MKRALFVTLATSFSLAGCQQIAGLDHVPGPQLGSLLVKVASSDSPTNYFAQATLSDVARVIVTVQTTGNANQNRMLTNEQLVSGGASASLNFGGLITGVATVSATAYDGANVVMGLAKATASIQQAQTAQVGLPIYLGPSYDFQSANGGLNANVSVINGSQVTVAPGSVRTIAGNGTTTSTTEGVPAANTSLGYPYSIARTPAGDIYVSCMAVGIQQNNIYRINKYGMITLLAYHPYLEPGAGTRGTPVLACDSAGNLYIGEKDFVGVKKVTPQGVVTTVAGTGTFGHSGDNGPATAAQINCPRGLAIDSNNNLYIAEDYQIRKVTPQGIITTVAGTGTRAYSGDGGSATAANLGLVFDIAVDSQNNLYLTDCDNGVIRKITPAGTISTIAGNGTFGFSGDNGPALAAQLDPGSLAVDNAGRVFLRDDWNRIRMVTPDGIISTLAGSRTYGFAGDGGPATQALFAVPIKLLVDNNGNLLVADNGNHRIRLIRY